MEFTMLLGLDVVEGAAIMFGGSVFGPV